LPDTKEIGNSWQDTRRKAGRREAKHMRPQRRDEQHLDQVVESQSEEAVDVTADEPARTGNGI
jgi:hypothetical protein